MHCVCFSLQLLVLDKLSFRKRVWFVHRQGQSGEQKIKIKQRNLLSFITISIILTMPEHMLQDLFIFTHFKCILTSPVGLSIKHCGCYLSFAKLVILMA